ncbi:MAG TPA: O-antigen ligase family protein [bacterium]|nr:O-antigen ligase family protein [bacterium]
MIHRSRNIFVSLLLVWTPLVFFFRAADGFTLAKEVVAVLAVAFLGVWTLFEGRGLFRQPLIQAALLFTLWMILDSLCVGLLKMEVLKGSVHLVLVSGTLLAVVFACSRGVSYEKLAHLILFTGTMMAIYGLFQSFGVEKVDWTSHFESRAFSTLGNPDYLGGYLVGLIPLAFILTIRSRHQESWLWFRAVTLFLLMGLWMTRVRGAFLALGAAALFLLAVFLFSWGRDLFRRNIRFVLAAFAVLVIAGGVYLTRHGGLAAFSAKQITVQQRVQLYQVVWEMVKDHPWFGIGLGQLGAQFPLYQSKPWAVADYPQHPYTFSEHAHNEYLQFLAEGGVPGLLLFLLILLVYAKSIQDFLKNTASKPEQKEFLIGIAGGMVALLVQSASNFPLQVAPTAVLFGFFLAAPLALRPSPPPPLEPAITRTQKVFLVLALLIPAIVGLRAVAASIAFRDTVGESSLGHGQLAAYYGGRLVSLSPVNPKAWNAYGKALEVAGQVEPAYQAYQKSLDLNPNYVENLLPMGQIRMNQGRLGEALALFQKAETITPNYSAPLWPMSVCLFQLKRYGESAKGFEEFLAYAPNDFQTYLDLGVCYMQLKRKEDAIAVWKKAYAVNPSDPQVVQYLKSLGVNPNR